MCFVYFQITNTVFVFKCIFSHSILYLYLNTFFHTVFCIFILNKYIFMYLCTSLSVALLASRDTNCLGEEAKKIPLQIAGG